MQLRQEASAIYYERNSIALDATDISLAALVTIQKQTGWWKFRSIALFGPIGPTSWDSVIHSCRACHQGSTDGIDYSVNYHIAWRLATRAFEIAKAMRYSPWEDVLAVLRIYKNAVGENNPQGWKWT